MNENNQHTSPLLIALTRSSNGSASSGSKLDWALILVVSHKTKTGTALAFATIDTNAVPNNYYLCES